MNEIVATSYNPVLVLLSYGFAVLGSYIALNGVYKLRTFREAHTSHRIEKIMGLPEQRTIVPSNRIYNATLLVSGVAFGGIGVWAMHFMGQLALRMPVDVDYAIAETLLSLVAAIAAATWGLSMVARNPHSWLRLIAAGAMLGLGVSAMHYLGMYSMRFGGFFLWNWSLVAVSMLIAFVAATAGLWLAFKTNTLLTRLLAALVMGGAVCAMHYTGMAAADVVCTTAPLVSDQANAHIIGGLQLPVLLVGLMVSIGLAVTLDRMYAPHLRMRT